MLKRLKSGRDKLEDQRKITYFPPAAMAWVNKLEFTGKSEKLIWLVKGTTKWKLTERSGKMTISSLFHLRLCKLQVSAWWWTGGCCWQAGPAVVETY